MTPLMLEQGGALVALGAFAGAQVLLVCISMVLGNVNPERALLIHAAGILLALLAVLSVAGAHPLFPEAALLLVLAASGLQLRELVAHAGVLLQPRRWLVATCVLLVPLLAVAAAFQPSLLLLGVAVWSALVAVVLWRVWAQSRPWIWWLLPGYASLAAAAVLLVLRGQLRGEHPVLAIAGLLTLWSACVFLATVWRSRILGETRARIQARNTVDPLTGLATPLVLGERLQAARNQLRRYGHPSVLLLVHIENLGKVAEEFGPEVAEAALLTAANRLQQSLRDGDIAARVSHSRMAVLAEGLTPAESAAEVASRILVAGLKEPLPAARAEFLHFRVALAAVPLKEVPPRQLLQRLFQRMDQELQAPGERRIVTLSEDELLASP